VILELLGKGGMGVVYKAYDPGLGRSIALKVLSTQGTSQALFERRLLREAQALARLSHPNVITVHDVGAVDAGVFVAMEFVEGSTLRQWLRDRQRSNREIVDAFVAAGEGLAAAHRAGLVHRDFKPDNVMVGSDGRVRVLDFGLARAAWNEAGEPAEEDESAAAAGQEEASSARSEPDSSSVRASAPTEGVDVVDPPGALGSGGAITSTSRWNDHFSHQLTHVGAVMGTPRFMAPEQHLGRAVDERADQFSFCVSLYGALYGTAPFAGRTTTEMRDAVLSGKVGDAPSDARVPGWQRQVLLRGLAVEPSKRYPSMSELLDALRRDPRAKRMRWVRFGVAALAVSAAAFGWRQQRRHQVRLCESAGSRLAGIWDDGVKDKVRGAFAATRAPYASETFRRIEGLLDRYANDWTAIRTDACEATQLRGEQSPQLMDLRMACLDRRAAEFAALSAVYQQADTSVVERAVQAANGLGDLKACSDASALLAAGKHEPTAPEQKKELSALRAELVRVKANVNAGRYARAVEEVAPLVERARRLGFEPATADALLLSARAKASAGKLEESLREASEAALEADAGGDDAMRVKAGTALVGWLSSMGRFDEAERTSVVAEAALRRTGQTGGRAEWLVATSTFLSRRGQLEESARRDREALEVARREDLSLEQIAEIQRHLATMEARLGHVPEAKALNEEADQMVIRALGPEHPLRIKFLGDRSFIVGAANDGLGMARYAEEAIALALRVAPDHGGLSVAYSNACSARASLHEYEVALPECEAGVEATIRLFGKDSINLTYAYANRGDALAGLERYQDAIASYQSAIDIHERTKTQDDSDYPYAVIMQAKAVLDSGKARTAVPMIERGLSILETALGSVSTIEQRRGTARFSLARALFQLGQRTPRVWQLATDALESYKRADDAEGSKLVEQWLADHPR
jgi:serine/threonine protein kinase/tetratricopeptide (TPR) repeat protein